MEDLTLLLALAGIVTSYLSRRISVSTQDVEMEHVVKTPKEHPPFHLTSHRVTDRPCICDYVYNKLDQAGLHPEKMTYIEATVAYDRLGKIIRNTKGCLSVKFSSPWAGAGVPGRHRGA